MNSRLNLSSLSVSLVAILLSCLFSFVIAVQNPILNNDAYGYLHAAEVFNNEGLKAVLSTYGWYGYSILIALADRILPGSMVLDAQLLNMAIYALLVHAFIWLCGEYKDTRRVQWFAALVILAFPLVNEMRYFLIRDVAYWAFSLLGLLQLMHFSRSGHLRSAAICCLALFAAILFRLEGLALLGLAPLSLLLPNPNLPLKRRIVRAAVLCGTMLCGILAIVATALLLEVNIVNLMLYAYRYYLPELSNLLQVLKITAENASSTLFTPDNFPGTHNTTVGLIIVLMAYLVTVLATIISALSLGLSLLFVYGFWNRMIQIPANSRGPLLAFITASVLVLLLFLFVMQFLTQRYVTLLSLLLLSLLPMILDKLFEKFQEMGKVQSFQFGLLLVCIYYFADSLVSFGFSKQYLEDAVLWSQNKLPAEARLQTNLYAVAYSSGRIADYDKVNLDAAATVKMSKPADYIIVEVRGNNPELKAQLDANTELQLLSSFANTRGDEARIYHHL